MTAYLAPQFDTQFFDGSTVAAGYKLYTYDSGTTTPKATYSDQAGVTPQTNPIILDAAGRVPGELFLGSGEYTLTLKTAADSLVKTWNDVAGASTTVDDALIRSDLASTSGAAKNAGMVGFSATLNYVAGTIGAVLRDVCINVKMFPWSAKGDGTTDDTAAVQAAVNAIVAGGGGTVYFPAGGIYLLNGSAGADSYSNGILIPMSSVGQHTAGVRLLGAGISSVIRGNANNLCVVRASRNFTTIENLLIDGQGGGGGAKTGVIGIGFIPQNITQTTTLTDQSFGVVKGCSVQNCTEGIQFQPGPNIGGADSGCFYHTIDSCDFNLNTRGLYFAKNVDWATHPNRTTRTAVRSTQIRRGNCGTYIDAGTEIDFYSVHYEIMNSGATPLATPTGLYVANNASVDNIRLYGGYAEACTAAVNIQKATGVYSFGFYYSGSAINWNNISNFGDFSATGTWTPAIASSGGGAASNITINQGYYSRIGRSVTVSCILAFDKGTLGAGNLTITGIPYSVKNATNSYQYFPVTEWSGLTLAANYTTPVGRASPGSGTIALLKNGTAGLTAGLLTVGELATTGNSLAMQSTYLVD